MTLKCTACHHIAEAFLDKVLDRGDCWHPAEIVDRCPECLALDTAVEIHLCVECSVNEATDDDHCVTCIDAAIASGELDPDELGEVA